MSRGKIIGKKVGNAIKSNKIKERMGELLTSPLRAFFPGTEATEPHLDGKPFLHLVLLVRVPIHVLLGIGPLAGDQLWYRHIDDY